MNQPVYRIIKVIGEGFSVALHLLPQAVDILLLFLLRLGEIVLTYSAERANEIIGKISKGCSCRNSVIGITYSLILFPSTYVTYIFHFIFPP